MPLKQVDLKTFDTYKKAIRMDLPKLVTGAKFWIYKDVELLNSSGKKEKITSFVALVDQNAIKKDLQGKKLICRGMAVMKDGKVSFDSLSGKVPYALLKKNVPLFLGKPLHIPTNADENAEGGDSEIEDDDESTQKAAPPAPTAAIPPPPPPPPAPTVASALSANWNQLVKNMQAAVALDPQKKEALTQAAAGIPDLIKANNVDEAQRRMNRLQVLMSAPPPPPPPGQAGGGLAGTWNKLVKDMQAAVAAHPEQKGALTAAAAGIPDLIKANKTAEAKQKMDQLQAVLDKASAAPATGAAAPPPPAPNAAELTARWNALVKQMQATIASKPEKKADIVRASAGIPDMIKVGKFDLAKKLMDGVDAVLSVSPAEKEYQARYGELEPRWLAALKEPDNDASRLRSIQAFAAEKAQAGDFEAALKSLKTLEDLLAKSAGAPEPNVDEDPDLADLEDQLAAAEERVEEVLRGNFGDVSQIRSVAAFAREKVEAGDAEAAQKALIRLGNLISAAFEEEKTKAGTRYQGVVKYRRALVEFAQAKSVVDGHLAAFKGKIIAKSPEEADFADEVVERLSDWSEELSDAIDEAMSASEDEAAPVDSTVMAALDKYLADLSQNELIKRVDKNPVHATLIEATLRPAIMKIKAAMPVLA